MANEEIDDEYDEIDDGDMEVAENDVNNEENMNSSDSETENVDSPHVNYDNNSLNLDYDETAYDCLYTLRTGYPLLSFDIIKDNLGDNRANQYPLTMTVVGGTEVKKIRKNHLMVIKMSNILKDKPHSDSDDSLLSEDDEEKEDEKPKLDIAHVPHKGCVNRVKVTYLNGDPFAASWSGVGKVHLWNLSRPLSAVNDSRVLAAYVQNKESVEPVYTFSGHQTEGFAMQWSPVEAGVLATGDVNSNIHLWKPLEGGTWHVDQRPYTAHTNSVEDIAWSPSETNVMATCSVDKTIRIWDMRAAPNKACMLTKCDAHDSDVNVIGWNTRDPFILSGGDDGKLKVWDLRQFPGADAVATFKYHSAPITSVEWHPTDHSMFAASSADDTATQWDLAVERDDEDEDNETRDLPAQLLFVHEGQKEIKELHWHPQMPGVMLATAHSGLNIVRTISV